MKVCPCSGTLYAHPMESLECVGGPCCGSQLSIRACEVEIDMRDGGRYLRRQIVPFTAKADPLWRLVRDVLDYRENR